MPRAERCCTKCRALPGTCALKRQCPCHPSTWKEDNVPDSDKPAQPKADRPPIFVRPTIAPRAPRPVSHGTSPFRAYRSNP